MQLSRLTLRVRSPETLARFYAEHFGMSAHSEAQAIVLGFGSGDTKIELRRCVPGQTYTHRRDDRYWKIGITLPNIDIAHDQLSRAGVAVSDPVQFGDIGYMCHLNDPEDFPIELLQHRFLGHRHDHDGNPDMPLGGGARLGQITLRVTDLPGAIAFYRDRLGMKLLSVQPVPDFDFVLYFLAFTDENPPVTDLEAVENREWLWQRPYTTLELQHFEQKKSGFALPDDGCPGFDSLLVTGAGHSTTCLWDEAGGTVYVAP